MSLAAGITNLPEGIYWITFHEWRPPRMMDHKDPATVEGYTVMRIWAVFFLLGATLAAGGCLTSQLQATTDRPVEASMDVFVQASIAQHMLDSACLFPFIAPHEMEAASPMLTRAFESRLVQRRPFARLQEIPRAVVSDAEALWYTRKEGCSLAILPYLQYMMDGTGGMPTKLVVRIRILDAANGQVLWDIKQSAWSNPGPDIDLTWNTITGAPAQRCRVLADCLAERFAAFLVHPLEQERQVESGSQQ
jgi:hypothetical protein